MESFLANVTGCCSCDAKWEARLWSILHPHPHRNPKEWHPGSEVRCGAQGCPGVEKLCEQPAAGSTQEWSEMPIGPLALDGWC